MKEEMIARIEGAKRNLGPLKIEILSAIFESQETVSEGVGAKRFRADHKEWIRELEDIESKHTLIRRTNDERDVYYVAPSSLPPQMPRDTEITLERGRIDGAPESDDKTGRRSSFSKLILPHRSPVTA